jgi:hypothetical protein
MALLKPKQIIEISPNIMPSMPDILSNKTTKYEKIGVQKFSIYNQFSMFQY